MNSTPAPKPPEPDRITRARERWARRHLEDVRLDERDVFLTELFEKLPTGLEPLLSALLSGLLLGAGFRFEQPVLLLAAVLLAPRMTSIFGIALGAIAGEIRGFFQMLFNLALLIVVVVITAGVIGGIGDPSPNQGVFIEQYSSFNWLGFLILVAASAISMLIFVRQGEFAVLPDIAVAYNILLPLGAFSIGLMRVENDLWFAGLLGFGLQVSWAVTTSVVVLVVLGFRPQTKTAGSFLISLPKPTSLSTLVPTSTTTSTPTEIPTLTATVEIAPSDTPTITPTLTPSITPTPAISIVLGTGGFGVILRETPNGEPIRGLFEGIRLEVIGGPIQIAEDRWVQVRTPQGEEGWVLLNFLATVTPTPES
jgi:hypothetical protein